MNLSYENFIQLILLEICKPYILTQVIWLEYPSSKHSYTIDLYIYIYTHSYTTSYLKGINHNI